MKIAETFEVIKAKFGVTKKAEIARVTGLDLRRVGDYMSGKREPTSDDYAKIATAAGINAGELWEAIQKERAKDENAKKVWDKYLKQLGGIAASLMLGSYALVTLLVTSSAAEAASSLVSGPATFCIM